MSRKFTTRFLIYGVVILYILLDLHAFKGPMHDWLMTKRGKDPDSLRAQGVCATVYGQPILNTQVQYRMQEYLYKRGRTPQDLTEKESHLLFSHCMEQLITEHLLRIKTHYNSQSISIEKNQLAEEVQHDLSCFSDQYEQKDALRRQGYAEAELPLRAEAHLQQRAYLDHVITAEPSQASNVAHSPATRSVPELLKIRHLFLSTWEKEPDEVKRKLEEHLIKLRSGELSFPELSTLINEDERAKKAGGELDWISAERMPDGLPLFTLKTGENGVFHSALGWHYVEILEKKPATTVTISEEDIYIRKENKRRRDGIKLYLRQLRAREAENISILWKGGEK